MLFQLNNPMKGQPSFHSVWYEYFQVLIKPFSAIWLIEYFINHTWYIYTYIFIQENQFENNVWKMSAILSGACPQSRPI